MKDEVEDSTGAGMGTTKFKSSDSDLTMSIDCTGATAEVVLRYWGSEIEAKTTVKLTKMDCILLKSSQILSILVIRNSSFF